MKLLGEKTLRLLVAIAKIIPDEVDAISYSRSGIVPWKYEPFNILGLSSRKYYHAYRSLEGRGYIKKYQRDIKITKKGKLAIIAHQARTKGIGRKWDGKWRAVIFDVPELSRKDRDFVRTHLKLLGLKECQKSVWISPWDVRSEVKDFFKLCDRKPAGSIRFIVIESMEDDKDLKKLFDIGRF